MKNDIQGLIEAYSRFRGLVEPNEFESLLFFFSEVGELAEAYLKDNQGSFTENQRTLLIEIYNAGLRADDEVSRMDSTWVRNNDRTKKTDIGSEIGDCRMMLEKFSRQFDGLDSESHLRRKMAKKGFRDVRLCEVSPDLQGKLTTRVWNKVKDSQATIRAVLKDWHNTGLVQELHLGSVGAKELMDALGEAGYYHSVIDLDDDIPIAKKV